jgi:hypothetical protein
LDEVPGEILIVVIGDDDGTAREIDAVEPEWFVGDAHPHATLHQTAGERDGAVISACDHVADGAGSHSRWRLRKRDFMTLSTDYTIDELISACIARQIIDGETVVQGIATPLVMAGVILAKLTHAPDIWLASAVGGTVCREWAPLGLATIEQPWLDHGLALMSVTHISCEFWPRFRPREFLRPAQVDQQAFNNAVMAITGRRCCPAAAASRCRCTTRARCCMLRHPRAVFVIKDFISGLHTPID